MTESNSTRPEQTAKTHPFTLHPTGQYCKKVRGKLHYFGRDLDAALKRWEREKDDLCAGRTPRPEADAMTVELACNHFLTHKEDLVDSGELARRSFDEYVATCNSIARAFGKTRLVDDLRPDDFARLRKQMALTIGPVRLGNEIQRVRSVFKHAYESELLDKPMRFGPNFKRPSKKVLRLHKAEKGKKLFARDEIRLFIDNADVQLKAMILLGINCGFGNADCGNLPLSALDLDNAVLDFTRPKTGVGRRCAMWPETVAAVRDAITRRPNPKSEADAGLVFITKQGWSWFKGKPGGPISHEMTKLMRRLGINGRRGIGFYTLRHTFRTVADETKDQPAVDFVMGHEADHISNHYREVISDERLRAVSAHVRDWLFNQDNS